MDELMVSRYHAAIALEQAHYVLYDRDSANGTWVNEQRVFRHVLEPGDRIQFWRSQFAFSQAGVPLPSPVSPTAPESAVRVEGEQIGRYSLEGLIGRGGMSEVFQARDAEGRTVAIKILQQSDPYLVDKFVQEGNKIGPLLRNHPNIVYVYEFGQSSDSRLYIVMEFVDAPSLRKALRRSLTEPEILRIMQQACSALAFAHQNDVVHRDIKPENILVTTEGLVKVLDFGIAKLTSAATVTRDKIIGTPEYISPEQAQGEPVRPASDVYSLGIVLYEMLAGSVPFPRPNIEDPYKAAMEVIRQHLKERPEALRKRNPSVQVSKRLERVVMRALEKDTRKRYRSAEEMGEALGYKEQVVDVPTPHVSAGPASLVVLKGPRTGYRFRLGQQTLSVGRYDLGSSNRAISRCHVNVCYRAGSYWLQDTSKNGTFVDRRRVYGEVPLRTGAIIEIGDVVLRLEKAS
jgi:serine/threonine protein kinase